VTDRSSPRAHRRPVNVLGIHTGRRPTMRTGGTQARYPRLPSRRPEWTIGGSRPPLAVSRPADGIARSRAAGVWPWPPWKDVCRRLSPTRRAMARGLGPTGRRPRRVGASPPGRSWRFGAKSSFRWSICAAASLRSGPTELSLPSANRRPVRRRMSSGTPSTVLGVAGDVSRETEVGAADELLPAVRRERWTVAVPSAATFTDAPSPTGRSLTRPTRSVWVGLGQSGRVAAPTASSTTGR
jgi:hypothetical protein